MKGIILVSLYFVNSDIYFYNVKYLMSSLTRVSTLTAAQQGSLVQYGREYRATVGKHKMHNIIVYKGHLFRS